MGISARIRGWLSDYGLAVSSNNAARVSDLPMPGRDWTKEDAREQKILNEYLTLNDSAAMQVDGSTTPQEFSVESSPDRVKFIKQLRFYHEASGMSLTNKNEIVQFGGAGAALSTGVELIVELDGAETDVFINPVTRTADFFIYSLGDFWGITGTTIDLLTFTIDLPVPVKLAPGTVDRVFVRINDDLTGSTAFRCHAYGWYQLTQEPV